MPNQLVDAPRRCCKGGVRGCGRYLLAGGTCPLGCPQMKNRGGRGRGDGQPKPRKPDTSPPVSDAEVRRMSTTLATKGIERVRRRLFILSSRGRACVNGCGVRGKRCPDCILADPMATLHQREMARAAKGIAAAGSEAAKRVKVYGVEERAELEAAMRRAGRIR